VKKKRIKMGINKREKEKKNGNKQERKGEEKWE
jgi:hypothetical protein